LVAALQTQTRLNREAAARAADLERRQTEWNALHYQILQRLVTEVSRTSIEVQAVGTRVESLAARVDFNDKRIRTLENTPAPTRTPRPQEAPPIPAATAVDTSATAEVVAPTTSPAATGDMPRRRRRRRRGRRGALPAADSTAPGGAASVLTETTGMADVEEGNDEDDVVEAPEAIGPARPESPSFEASAAGALETPPPSWSPQAEVSPAVEHQGPQSEAAQSAPTSTPSDAPDSGEPEK